MSISVDAISLPSSRRAGVLIHQALILGLFMAASAVPTPLYRLYQDVWHFSPTMLTVVFGVYALSLLAALLTVGRVSDHIGRRPVIFAALAGEALAFILFLVADGTALLMTARVFQGVATGAAMSAIGAALLDVDRKVGATITGTAPLVGMALGALGTSVLVAVAPLPLRLVYAVLLAATVVEMAAMWRLPETACRRAWMWISLRPRLMVPEAARGAFWRVSPVNIAVWALGGFFLSLVPTLARVVTGHTSPLLGGLVVATLNLSGALGIHVLRNGSASVALVRGTAALAGGVVLLLGGVYGGSAPFLFIGTAVAGYGYGAGFLGCMRTLSPLAPSGERAALLAAFYTQSYLSFSVLAMMAGALTDVIGLVPATTVYAAVLAVLALGGGLASRRAMKPASCPA